MCDPGSRTDQPETGGADNLVQLRYEWHTQQARREAAEEEVKQIAPTRVGAAALRNLQNPAAILNELRPVLEADYADLRKAAIKTATTARTRQDEARKDWEELYRQRIAFRQYSDQQQAVYGFDFDTGAASHSSRPYSMREWLCGRR